MLTRNEKMLCADALNGVYLVEEYYARMIGTDPQPAGTVSGLYAEIYDAIRFNALDKKWDVDRAQLLAKLHAMPIEDRKTLLNAIADAWRTNDDTFERRLEEIEV